MVSELNSCCARPNVEHYRLSDLPRHVVQDDHVWLLDILTKKCREWLLYM